MGQFCSNSPESFIEAARLAQTYCDAVDLNLGCPQGIARRGHYGAYLQDEWELIENIIKQAVISLEVPVTCKLRIFPDVTRTIAYAKMLESAGASLLSVHGRTREMKGHSTGMADWEQIKCVKQAVQIPVIANGNIEYLSDVHRCFSETGVDAVMSAEGHLHNPTLFTGLKSPVIDVCFEYLSLCKRYPCQMSIIRGHLFKLCYHMLNEHTEFRSVLGSAQTIEGLKETIRRLSSVCKQCKVNSGSSLPLPHWICQPYRRSLKAFEEPVAGDLSSRDPPDNNTHKQDLAILRHLRRETRKQMKALKKRAKTCKLLCSNCKTNRMSDQCCLDCCRTCCRTLDPNRLRGCTVHVHPKKLHE